jgi:hypothetical protein
LLHSEQTYNFLKTPSEIQVQLVSDSGVLKKYHSHPLYPLFY